MASVADNAVWSSWLIQYGGLLLFFLLALGILALPVPEESLMVLAGILISKASLELFSTLLAAYTGSMCGITMSYFVGAKGGRYLIDRYGHQKWIGKPFNKAQQWFHRFGKWTLLVGYFIPGVRHFTGLLSGMVGMPFREFALFAYIGAVLWVSLFIFLGVFLESYCLSSIQEWDWDTAVTACLIILALLGFIFFIRLRSKRLR